MTAANGGSIHTLQKHIEDMRSLVMCKICLKPFYEPYILACGHTYCYGCLNNWFSGNAERQKHNKNCPDCRMVVKVQPAPNYLLRDLTHMFIGRIELLPEDETVEEHNRDKDEEASLLTRDRNGRGLFGGLFKNVAPRPIMPYVPIRDYEDGVIRCPTCAWEIEDGICMGCGLGLPGEGDISLSDSFDDAMSEDSDSDESSTSELPIPQPPQQFYGVGSDSEDDEEDSQFGTSQDPDIYDAHDDFIDDDYEVDADDIDAVHAFDGYPDEPSTPYSDGNSPTAQEDYDEEDGIWPRRRVADMLAEATDVQFGSDMDDEDEDDEIVRPASRHRHRAAAAGPVPAYRRRPIIISDEDDDEEDQTPSPQPRAPAPLPISENEDSSDDSEEDDDQSSSPESGADPESDDASSGSDDTIIPPQSNRDRRQRLEAHRARRPTPSSRVAIDLVTPPRPPRQTNHSRGRGNDVARNAKRNRVSVH